MTTRSTDAHAHVREAVSRLGLFTADLPGKSARYRGVLVGAGREALPPGISRAGEMRDTRGRQRATRLAHLCRFCSGAIRQARTLYANNVLEIDLDAMVYELDSITFDLCLVLFDWVPYRSTKAAIKLHTLLDLRGNIPSFIYAASVTRIPRPAKCPWPFRHRQCLPPCSGAWWRSLFRRVSNDPFIALQPKSPVSALTVRVKRRQALRSMRAAGTAPLWQYVIYQ